MIILHVVPYFAPAWAFGGVVRAVAGLARAQVDAGHEPIVLTTDALTRSTRLPQGATTVDGTSVLRVRNRSSAARSRLNLSTPVNFRAALDGLLERHAVEVVHCHELRTIETLHVARLPAPTAPARIVSPHGTLPYTSGRTVAKRAWDRLLAKQMLPAFDAVAALTPAEAGDARSLWARFQVPIDDAQIRIVPNGVDPAAFAGRPAREAARARWHLGNGPVVLFLGRLAERKGVDLLVQAFAEAARGRPDARLLIAGPDEGAGRQVRAAVARLGLSDRVTHAGLLSDDDRLAALAAADLFALPAIGEGLPVAALEALACGVPVLASPDCHLPDLETEGAGLVVARTPAAWAAALGQLVDDEARRDTMSTRARSLACRRYTWARVAAEMDAAYGVALTRRARRAP
jgi:glycosyltransferase involved in cell wall biosynthesis